MVSSIKSLNYPGLYKENVSFREKYFFSEKIATRSIQFDWRVYPHFHSHLYQIFIVEKGSAHIYLNSQQCFYEGPFLIYIPPNHIHGFNFSEDVQGRIITFSQYYTKYFFREFPTIENETQNALIIRNDSQSGEDPLELMKNTVNLIDQEFNTCCKHKDISVSMYTSTFLLLLTRLPQLMKGEEKKEDNIHELEYFNRFKELIRQAESPFKSIAAYAKLLGVSTSHLNRICRDIENTSSLQVIQNEILLSSKALLYNRKYNIEEVSFALGFEDPSYFTRFFKKKTGLTPKQFRSQILSENA